MNDADIIKTGRGSLVEDCKLNQVRVIDVLETLYSVPRWCQTLCLCLPSKWQHLAWGFFESLFGRVFDKTLLLDNGDRCSARYCCELIEESK